MSAQAANNYAASLRDLERFEEARAVLRKTMPVARRVLGPSNEVTLVLRKVYARALYQDPAATLDDLREAVASLEETERIARRVFGREHPRAKGIEQELRKARAALRACETPRGDGVEDDDDDEDGWETASSDEEAPTEAPP